MKFLSDLLVRQEAARVGFPLAVVNPSTVIGSKTTGSTDQLGGIFDRGFDEYISSFCCTI